jgi:hypothetical protein
MNIRTQMYLTPWGQEWHAVDDDTYDGAEDAHSPIGSGKTEREAIDDLKDRIMERNLDAMRNAK